jgi:tetratricopeptide (TPR) repeat protein
MGRAAEGLERLQRAQVLSEASVQDRPDDPESQTALAACYADLGRIQAHRRLAPAFPLLEKALAIAGRLARTEPTYRHRYDEAGILSLIGRRYYDSGNAAESLAHCDRAREILERLHRERPDDVDTTDQLALAWYSIGSVHRAMTHRTEAALDAFRQALGFYDQLARDNPAVVHLRSRRHVADFGLGDQLSAAGRFAEAEAVLRPAIEEGEQIIRADPADSRMRLRLTDAEISLARALHGLGRTAEALAPLARARDLLEALRQSDPDDLRTLINLARCMHFLGVTQAELGRREEAIQSLSNSETGTRLDSAACHVPPSSGSGPAACKRPASSAATPFCYSRAVGPATIKKAATIGAVARRDSNELPPNW